MSMQRAVSLVFTTLMATFLFVPAAAAADRFLLAAGQEVTFNIIDPGTATCIGGTATGNPLNPCVGSTRVFLKHQVVQTMLLPGATGDAVPLLAGANTVTLDCNLDGALKGNCWGTFEWAVDDSSKWAGTANGTFDFVTFVISYRLNGSGFGGVVDGKHLQYDVFYDGGWDFVGDFAARVHVPGN